MENGGGKPRVVCQYWRDIPNAPAVLAEDSCRKKEKAVEVKVRQLEGELKLGK